LLSVPFQIIRKINDQIWVWDGKILKSRFGVYTYHIVSTVIISVPAVWIAMSQGVSGRCVELWVVLEGGCVA
jgi:hypothetical protein